MPSLSVLQHLDDRVEQRVPVHPLRAGREGVCMQSCNTVPLSHSQDAPNDCHRHVKESLTVLAYYRYSPAIGRSAAHDTLPTFLTAAAPGSAGRGGADGGGGDTVAVSGATLARPPAPRAMAPPSPSAPMAPVKLTRLPAGGTAGAVLTAATDRPDPPQPAASAPPPAPPPPPLAPCCPSTEPLRPPLSSSSCALNVALVGLRAKPSRDAPISTPLPAPCQGRTRFSTRPDAKAQQRPGKACSPDLSDLMPRQLPQEAGVDRVLQRVVDRLSAMPAFTTAA